MINIKKNGAGIFLFVLFLTCGVFVSCGPKKYYNSSVEGKKIPITEEFTPVAEIENFIAPYREHIDRDLDSVLAYSPETLDKSKPIKKWQTTIGNLMADVTFNKADKLFFAREKKHVDICLLNHGGIRSVISKGNVTARTAYEIMPFENSLIIAAVKGIQVKEIAEYIAKEKKPHPLSGMRIILDANGMVKSLTVQDKAVEDNSIYYVASSDYLTNGGDKMDFFKKAVATYDMDYKLRNLFIDYFKETDTLPVIKTERIIVE